MEQKALPVLLLVTPTKDLERGWGRFSCFGEELQLVLEFVDTTLQTLWHRSGCGRDLNECYRETCSEVRLKLRSIPNARLSSLSHTVRHCSPYSSHMTSMSSSSSRLWSSRQSPRSSSRYGYCASSGAWKILYPSHNT
jgi:hypothetical protein